MRDIDTPLHPRAACLAHHRLIGEAYVRLDLDLSQMSDTFRLVSERMLMLQYSMIQLQKPLSLITLTGV
jgi:hypothetical protein